MGAPVGEGVHKISAIPNITFRCLPECRQRWLIVHSQGLHSILMRACCQTAAAREEGTRHGKQRLATAEKTRRCCRRGETGGASGAGCPDGLRSYANEGVQG